MQATYLIPGCNLDYLREKLDDLNKRARRIGAVETTLETELAHIQRGGIFQGQDSEWLGTSEMTPEAHQERRQSWFGPTRSFRWTGQVREWLNVTITGDTPKFEGWSLIAVLEPLVTEDGAENIIQAVPGHECPTEYRDRVGQCDHCHTNRRRNQTFVVQHDNGDHRMVGRQCLKDFLGHSNPHALASMAEMLASLALLFSSAEDEDFRGGWRAESAWNLETFLRWTSSSIRQTGWTSGKAAFENYTQSTKSHVLQLLTPPASESVEWRREMEKFSPNEADEDRARRAIEWALDIDREDEDLSDYLYNVNLTARAGYVNLKTAGVAASIIYAYSRWESQEIERRREALRLNEHVGTPKIRQDFTVDVVKVIENEGNYGLTGIHKMYDEEGRSLVWFASGSAKWLDPGKRYRVKATVKRHDEFRDRLQTHVNRLTILEELGDIPEVPVTLEATPAAPEAAAPTQEVRILRAPVRYEDVQ
jgi:hypothetical protein